MDSAQHLQAGLLALLAGFSNFMGGLAITSRKSWDRAAFGMCLALGAGFMLALSVLKLLPLSLEYSSNATLYMLVGYLIVHFFEHTLSPHFHFGEEVHHEELVKPVVGWTAFIGLAIHSLFDGIAMASGFAIDFSLGLIIFVALLLHKLPEGFTVATIFLVSGRSRAAALLASTALGLLSITGFFLLIRFKQHLGIALPISAGATLYVAASDLIPAVNEEKGIRMSLCVFVGVCLFYITESLIDKFGL
ncbi:MAG: ZIP family metal transporter [Acidobacteriota bacterium]